MYPASRQCSYHHLSTQATANMAGRTETSLFPRNEGCRNQAIVEIKYQSVRTLYVICRRNKTYFWAWNKRNDKVTQTFHPCCAQKCGEVVLYVSSWQAGQWPGRVLATTGWITQLHRQQQARLQKHRQTFTLKNEEQEQEWKKQGQDYQEWRLQEPRWSRDKIANKHILQYH